MKRLNGLFGAAVLLMAPATAQAALVTYDFVASIADRSGPSAPAGSRIDGSFTYDSAAVPYQTSPTMALYRTVFHSITWRVDSTTYALVVPADNATTSTIINDDGGDVMQLVASCTGCVVPGLSSRIVLSFTDHSGRFLTSTAPKESLSLSGPTSATLEIDSFDFIPQGYRANLIELRPAATPVPVAEPTTLALFGAAVLGLAGLRRQARSARAAAAAALPSATTSRSFA